MFFLVLCALFFLMFIRSHLEMSIRNIFTAESRTHHAHSDTQIQNGRRRVSGSLNNCFILLFVWKMVRSRLQKEVLSLYRRFLRASQDKPGFTEHIKYEFRKNSGIPKTDGLRIEYLLRRAQNQLKQLEKMECKSMGFFAQHED